MSNPWDNRPNLSKLPHLIREQLNQAVPHRPNEVATKTVIFKKTQGLIHPNARLLITEHRKDPNVFSGPPDGIQIDSMDFSGRVPLLSLILPKVSVPAVLENIIRGYLALGGTEEGLAEIQAKAKRPLQGMGLTTYYEDEGSRD
jgi:hypothetical protein